jgi:nitroreductase
MLLDLTPDELLATTRSVRKRLDLTRPVEREVLEECLRLAQQAPTASYAQNWHFVVVTDPERRAALGELWRSVAGPYVERRAAAAAADERVARISDAVRYLADHIHQVPVHMIPCVEGRTDHVPVVVQASRWGSIIPAAWTFMLAARARGLGTVWTTFHLRHEREAAEVLGDPIRGGDAGGADPGRLHRRDRLPARRPPPLRNDGPLGWVVGRLAMPGRAAWSSGRSFGDVAGNESPSTVVGG